MTRDDLEEALGGNKLAYGSVSAELLFALYKFVKVGLEMDDVTKDYFYKVDAEELIKSDAPVQILDELNEGGWALDSSKRYIELYLKA